jgi:hypothetical protein
VEVLRNRASVNYDTTADTVTSPNVTAAEGGVLVRCQRAASHVPASVWPYLDVKKQFG